MDQPPLKSKEESATEKQGEMQQNLKRFKQEAEQKLKDKEALKNMMLQDRERGVSRINKPDFNPRADRSLFRFGETVTLEVSLPK